MELLCKISFFWFNHFLEYDLVLEQLIYFAFFHLRLVLFFDTIILHHLDNAFEKWLHVGLTLYLL